MKWLRKLLLPKHVFILETDVGHTTIIRAFLDKEEFEKYKKGMDYRGFETKITEILFNCKATHGWKVDTSL